MKTILPVVVGVGLALVGAGAAARAQESAQKKVKLAIQSETLADALAQWADQTDLQLISTVEQTRVLSAPEIKGRFTPQMALDRLLAGTALTSTWVNDRTVAIRERVATLPTASQEGASPTAAALSAQDAVSAGASSKSAVAGREASTRDPQIVDELEEITVTGSRISRSASDGPQDVRVYTRSQIERSGQSTVSQFLSALPSASVSSQESGMQHAFGSSTVQLRGLPVGTTLVLINGHRVQTSGTQSVANFFDLNNLPLAAVERIEVVANGSSAIYGSDAIAGVVNVVLRNTFAGLELNGKYGNAKNNSETSSSVAWGRVWDSGNVALVASYFDREELLGSSRRLTASNDYQAFGGPNNNFTLCNPGNVFFPGGYTFANGVSAEYAAVPSQLGESPSAEDFATTAGTLNECTFNSQVVSIIPETRRTGLLLTASQDVGQGLSFFGELLFSNSKQNMKVSRSFLFGIPEFQQFTVDAANPFNPFGTTVGVTYAFPDHLQTQDAETDFVRPLIGARGTFKNDWAWEISALHSEDSTKSRLKNALMDSTAVQDALNSSDAATALNPFIAGAPAAASLVDQFFSDGLIEFEGRSQVVTGFSRGSLFSLPSGPLKAVIGIEMERERLHANYVNFPTELPGGKATFDRRVRSMFSEVRAPLISSAQRETLALTVAGRYDDYDDFGSEANPQFGLEWRPTRSLLVRATYAEAFKAPSLDALYAPRQILPENVVQDPLTGEDVIVPVIVGGNPALNPETGHSSTIGLTYSSEAVPGLQALLTHWSVRQEETIQPVQAQYLVDNEDVFGDRVTRDSLGALSLIDSSAVNFGSIDVAGLDYEVSYRRPTRVGEWHGSISASQTYKYEAQLVAGGAVIDRVSAADDSSAWAVRWKGAGTLGWIAGPSSLNIVGRYLGRYRDYNSTRHIGNTWLVDANLRIDIGEVLPAFKRSVRETYIEVGAVNLLDRLPQYSNFSQSFLGYDPAQADIRGRYVYVQFGLKM